MKYCPKCEAEYKQDSLNFCLEDGSALTLSPTTRQPLTTLVIPKTLRDIRNFRHPSFIILVVISIIIVSFFVLYSKFWFQDTTEPATSVNNVNESVTSVDNANESAISIDNAIVSLDMTRSWMELNEQQRKENKVSKAILHGEFILRKYDNVAQFGHRLGTTSRFEPEWRSSTHSVIGKKDQRKCSPEVKYSYMLYIDVSKESIDVPFKLSYEIDFWNAHNGQKGDWHAFYVAHPTKELTIKVSFPKSKPYKDYRLKSVYGIDCGSLPEEHPKSNVKEEFDKKTGTKTISWTISPNVHWIYRIEWDW